MKPNAPPVVSARHAFAAALLSFVIVVQPAWAGAGRRQTPAGAELPPTPVGRLARLFFAALNSGEQQQLLGFIRANYSDDALRQTAPEELLAYFGKLYRQSGGLEVRQVSADSGESFLVLDVRSRRGNHWARMFFVSGGAQNQKLSEIGMFPVRDPRAATEDAWPEAKMGEAEAVEEIARRVEREAAEDRFSGTVLIARGGRIIFHRAYGMAEKGFGVANRPDTKFNLGSMNKMFTSVAVAQLVEAGKLSFEDTVAKLLPEYPNRQAAEKITVHHLLTHTSGLGDFFDHPEFRPYRQRYRSPRDYFRLFADRPLRFEPGTRFGYSNAGFVVLGAVVEKVSGRDYFDYVREHIYKPAGMPDSDSYELTEVVPNLAVGYGRFEDDPLGVDPRRSNVAFLPWKGSPAGGGYSTATDLLKFALALRGHKLLSARMTELVTSPKTPMTGAPRPGQYGYGFIIEEVSGRELRGHGGGGPNSGINSDLRIFWDAGYTSIVLSNYDAPAAEELNHRICRLLARQVQGA